MPDRIHQWVSACRDGTTEWCSQCGCLRFLAENTDSGKQEFSVPGRPAHDVLAEPLCVMSGHVISEIDGHASAETKMEDIDRLQRITRTGPYQR